MQFFPNYRITLTWHLTMSHIDWVTRQNKLEIPRDKDEVNKREIREYDGRAHVDVCSWGGGGGEEELQGTTVETFSQDDASSKQTCFLCLYYMLSSGGFAAHAFRPSRRVSSILETLCRECALFKLRQPVDLCHTLRQ